MHSLKRVNYDIETSSAVKLNQMMFYNDQMDMSRFDMCLLTVMVIPHF